ncbi:hypothetical protein [Heyndrickxia sporothermodurans]|uniref:Uncharacterized protein n=1 Tax=Heyndrickxia sporothermodurans TaxID=46224 RepID=A0A150KT07_9BACI|nr:hypothetical protein [Heyndrickxia sporothermodurans]KYD02691.1 hypothetical protein B4102_0286 [Heyndrickxia sporothermodurans]
MGFHLNDTFISCDKCGEIIDNEEKTESAVKSPKKPIDIDDYDLPF